MFFSHGPDLFPVFYVAYCRRMALSMKTCICYAVIPIGLEIVNHLDNRKGLLNDFSFVSAVRLC